MKGQRRVDRFDLELVTYLTFDSVVSGVGRSQVLPYVEKIAARGIMIRLVSFEKADSEYVRDRLLRAGVNWTPERFGRPGPIGGLFRTVRATKAVNHSLIVHARSDLPAFAALASGSRYVLWDCRAFWLDQRIATKSMRRLSILALVLRWIEKFLASKSDHINILTNSGMTRMAQKYGEDLKPKLSVISTCVDLDKFVERSLPESSKIRVLLAGSMNGLYDVSRMVAIFEQLKKIAPAELVVATSDSLSWGRIVGGLGAVIGSWDHEEMPDLISSCHIGFSVCVDRSDDSLTATMPTKIAEFLASGRPIVVSPGLTDAAFLVKRYGCGIVAGEYETSESIATRIYELLGNDGLTESCRRAAEENFSLNDAADRLTSLYLAGARSLGVA